MSTRVFALGNLDRARVVSHLHGGLLEAPKVAAINMSGMTPEQRAAYLARARDLNNVIWTGACVELAARIGTVNPSDPGFERAGSVPGRSSYTTLRAASFVWSGSNSENRQAFHEARKAMPHDPIALASDCVQASGTDSRHIDAFPGGFYLRVPVGELGAELAYALVEAARLCIPVAEQTATQLATPSIKATIGGLSLLNQPAEILAEGIASIATTLGLLLVKRPPPPYDHADAALALLAESHTVTLLAALAPFGVLGPMAVTGLVPSEPIGVVRRKDGTYRAQVPATFEALLDSMRQDHAKTLHHGDLQNRAFGDQRGATARGCPVAGRGPIITDDGRVAMTADAGLTMLTHAFVALTRKILAQRAAASRG